MIRILITALALLLPTIALAQTVPVRSGEHAGFTRLVLDMPRRIGWRAQARDTGASLIFDLPDDVPDLDFNLGSVFERIGRERVRAVSSSPGRLNIQFACECALRAYWHGARMLVLDIAAVPSPAPGESVARLRPALTPVKEPSGLRQGSVAILSLVDRPNVMTGPAAATMQEGGESRDPQAMSPDLSAIRDALVEQLGRAASQGLLTPVRGAVASPGTERPPQPAPEVADMPAPAQPQDASRVPVNMRAQSSVDQGFSGSTRRAAITIEEDSCPASDWMNITAWGGRAPFYEELGRLNRELLGEFDRPNEAVALELARFYLHYGFGAEARLALALGGYSDAQGDLLREMSLIVDQEASGSMPGLARAVICDAPTMLWAILAVPDLPEDLIFDHKGLLRAFVGLPDGLRQSLGPGLARRLMTAGHRETSQSILRVIDRHAETDDPETALAQAELAWARQEPDRARSALGVAVQGNSTASAEALLALIEDLLDTGKPVPLDRAELAGAYAHEFRDTALGHRMTRAYIAALANAGAYEKAVQEFDRLRAAIDPTATDRATAGLLIGQMSRHADDVTFLRHVLSGRLGGPGQFDPAIAREIAGRLLAAGFAGRAGAFVDRDLAGHDAPDSRFLRAEIALAQMQPRAAEVELLGLDGPKADGLRARARSLAGDHLAAARFYARGGQTNAAEGAAFFAADPGPLAGAEDPVLRDVADLLRQTVSAEPSPEEAPLAHHRRAIDAAAMARQVLDRLLTETPGPDIPVN